MQSNTGKFVDRMPIICAAGKVKKPSESVEDVLKETKLDEVVTAIKHDARIWKEDEFIPPRKLPPAENVQFKGIYTEIKDAIHPKLMTRYQQLINDLKETTYKSFWNAEIGKSRDPVPGLPKGMDPETVTFGICTKSRDSAKDLLNPPKTPYEVLYNSQIGHRNYIISHNDYNPSEQINRNYYAPPYNPKQINGIKSKYDPRGAGAKCTMSWFDNEPVTYCNEIQANYCKKYRHRLGKGLAPNRIMDQLPKGHTFGKPLSQSIYDVEGLLKDPSCPINYCKRDFLQWLGTFNKLRIRIKEKIKNGWNLRDFERKLKYFDKEQNNFIPLNIFYQHCVCDKLHFFKDDFENLLKTLNVIVGDEINYKKFVQMADVNGEFELIPIKDIPPNNLHYLTSSQANRYDYLLIDNSKLPPAGQPTVRYDISYPVIPQGSCRADAGNLGDDTTVGALLNPNIYMHHGLNYKDFFEPRSKETIRDLFEKVGYIFKGDSFEELYKIAMEIDKNNEVCVDTFKNLVERTLVPKKIIVDEADCEKL